jgi:hypothetical protein
MTQDEIIEMAQECGLIGMRPHLDGIYSEALVAFAKLVAERALADPMREVQRLGQEIEQEPVAVFYLPIRKDMRKDVEALIDHAKRARWTNVVVRKDAVETTYEADWIKELIPYTPPQRTEQERDEILQAITDPENQPSQFGTVTLEYHEEKIKQWEDLFNRMSANFERASDKVIAQRTEQNFCSRCGKRTPDLTHIHTCTPPKD